MNNIETLKDNGYKKSVKFYYLKDISIMQRGTSITKKTGIKGKIPVISGGKEPAFFCEHSNRHGNIITVAGSGVGAGYVQYWDTPIFVCDSFSIEAKNNIFTKYIYYYLTKIQNKIYTMKKGAGVPHIHISSIDKFKIPVPSIEFQQQIIEILDNFTKLITSLDKEIKLRQKQYEYYRNILLNKNTIYSIQLDELFNLRNGYTPSTKNNLFWENGTIPWFKMEDIRENGNILNDSINHITSKAIKGKGLFKKNTFIISTSATIGEYALIKKEHLSNQRFTNLEIKEKYKDIINIKYLYYYFNILSTWCTENVNISGFASVDMNGFKKFIFNLPSIKEQNKIVEDLDNFTNIIDNLKKERNIRQKQYEYYRDKLLNFEEIAE